MRTESLRSWAKGVGVVSGVGCVGLFLVLIVANPYSEGPVRSATKGVAAAESLLAIVAVAASLLESWPVLLIVFALSFVPVGAYLLGTPGIFCWIGVAHLGYLLAAGLLIAAGRKKRRT
jgi:hypothetical protein